MVACFTGKSFYHSYDLSIYCDDGFFYKSAYKIGRVSAYLEIFALHTPLNQIYEYLASSPESLTNY